MPGTEETTTSVGSHPLLAALHGATAQLTGPGAPFEVVEEDVLGERMLVFRNRPRAMRDLLAQGAAHGDRDCYVFSDGRRITFAELPGQVASVAGFLHDRHGIRAGDRVAICAANGAGWLLTMWACGVLGAVAVAMNGWWTEPEMRNALDLTEPKLLVLDRKRADRLGPTPGLGRPNLGRVDIDDELESMLDHPSTVAGAEVPIAEDDPAMLMFTSGTTGRPKAAVMTNRMVIAYAMEQLFVGARGMVGQAAPPPGPAVRLAVFPLFHVSGLGVALTSVMGGSTAVWPLGRFDPGAVIDLTVKEGINAWMGTATHIMRLLEHPDLDRVDPHQLRQVGMGGSATRPDIVRRCDDRFPHLRGTMSSGYGSTESGGLATFAPNWLLAEAPDCVGPPLPTVELRITDDDRQVLADGEVGHIWVRSPLVMPGYWRHDEANAEVFDVGRWYCTGDFGRIEDGLLFIASRLRDLIIRGGENIYPFEIENRIEELPEVVEAAVFGVDHDVLGQEVKAVIVVAEGASLTAEDVREFCAQGLASYKIPAHIELRTEALPRNPAGKVLKHVLVTGVDATFVGDQ